MAPVALVKTHPVHIEPAGLSIEARDGEALLHAALRQGLRWPSVCGGQARCGTCHVDVTRTEAPLTPPATPEREALNLVPAHRRRAATRLACQLRVRCELTVERDMVRPRTGSAPSDVETGIQDDR